MSEGQGYGLLLAGAAAAALPAGHPRRDEVVALALEYFRGWEAMCMGTMANSCQDAYLCGANGEFKCLPSWKFNNDVSSEVGTGSAPDGDEVYLTQIAPHKMQRALCVVAYTMLENMFIAHVRMHAPPL